MKAVETRFTQYIQNNVNKFNAKYMRKNALQFPSGQTDILKVSCDEYLDTHNKSFYYVHCLEILRVLPKFDVTSDLYLDSNNRPKKGSNDDDDDDDDDEVQVLEYNNITGGMGAGLPRPKGSKQAKLENKEEKAQASMVSKAMGKMDHMNNTISQLSAAVVRKMASDNRKTAYDQHHKELDRLTKNIELCNSCPQFSDRVPALMEQLMEMTARGPIYEQEAAVEDSKEEDKKEEGSKEDDTGKEAEDEDESASYYDTEAISKAGFPDSDDEEERGSSDQASAAVAV